MKRQIRSGLWETNSSSTHTVYFTSGDMQEDISELSKYIQNDGYLHIEFGEFGWEIKSYTDAYTKLQYALTMAFVTECTEIVKDDKDTFSFEETAGYKDINDLIACRLHCSGIKIDSKIKLRSYEDSDGTIVMYLTCNDGDIDHQSSTDIYNSLQDFLDYYEISLERFIFDSNVVLHTDNDNY